MAILFYMLDMKSITLNTSPNISDILEVRAILKQIYKNVRSLLYYNPLCRATLNLQTKDDGIYVTDVVIGIIDNMIQYCEMNGYTVRNLFIIAAELNNFEVMVKNVLQYFHYFIRPDFRQKPDIDTATEKYKDIADERTLEELRSIVGKKHLIDFENLGISKITMTPKLEEKDKDETEKEDEDLDIIENMQDKDDESE